MEDGICFDKMCGLGGEGGKESMVTASYIILDWCVIIFFDEKNKALNSIL